MPGKPRGRDELTSATRSSKVLNLKRFCRLGLGCKSRSSSELILLQSTARRKSSSGANEHGPRAAVAAAAAAAAVAVAARLHAPAGGLR